MQGKNPEEKESPMSSPFGEVKDEEVLARFVSLAPNHMVHKNKRIRAGALQIDELFPPSDGWSFCRQYHVDSMSERVEQHAESRANGQPYGYASIRAFEIRQITDEGGNQIFCTVADPKDMDPAHALAIAKRAREYSKSDLREFRKILLAKFSDIKTGDN